MKNRLIQGLITCSIFGLLIYLSFAFSQLEMNAFKWDSETRGWFLYFLWCTLSGIALVTSAFIHSDKVKNK